MATNGVDAFLRAEDEANRLVDELARLRQETESYQTARESLDRTAEGVSGLATRLGELSGRLGAVVETLRSIGTPELLRAQNETRDALSAEIADTRAEMRTMRNVTIGGVALLVVALAILGWIALSLARP
jgi:chromosome segregation ATPase